MLSAVADGSSELLIDFKSSVQAEKLRAGARRIYGGVGTYCDLLFRTPQLRCHCSPEVCLRGTLTFER